jgi:predicted RNase H-like HicB family nuclease
MKRRTEQLSIRLTRQERAALENAAKERGFRELEDYVRAAASAGALPVERTYSVVVHPGEADEGGFWAEIPALKGCNTQGETYAETIANARRAIEGYLRMLVKLGRPIPVEKQPVSKTVAAVRVAV